MSLFGTDGIRAKAGEFPLQDRWLTRLGREFSRVASAGRNALVLMARDTRVVIEGEDVYAEMQLLLECWHLARFDWVFDV